MRDSMLNVVDIVILEKLAKKADLVNGKIPVSQIPSIITEDAAHIEEVPTYSSLPQRGNSNFLYLTADTSDLYRWANSKQTFTRENILKIEVGTDETFSSQTFYLSLIEGVKNYSIGITEECSYIRFSSLLEDDSYWESISIECEPIDDDVTQASATEGAIESISERSSDEDFSINKNLFPRYYPTSAEETFSTATTQWGFKNIENNGFGIHFKPGEGELYTKTSLPRNIKKITFTWASADYLKIGGNDGVTLSEFISALAAVRTEIPTKTSELENDSGYITAIPEDYKQEVDKAVSESINEAISNITFTETDPTVPEWAKADTKPSYTADEVGALPASTIIPVVPTEISAFINDTGYITSIPDEYVTDSKLADKGYLTEHQSLEGLATEEFVTKKISEIPDPDVSSQIELHNTGTAAHSDIRIAVEGLASRLNAIADSDDTTLDQLSEIVTYIKSNKTLIDGITKSKVSVSDIINNLTTSVSNKPLSAAQGVALKRLIDAIVVPTKVSDLENDLGFTNNTGTITEVKLGETAYKPTAGIITLPSYPDVPALAAVAVSGSYLDLLNRPTVPTKVSELTNDANYLTSYQETDPNVPAWAKQATKPSYTAAEVGALSSDTVVPTRLSDMISDDTHQVVTLSEKTKWNASAEVIIPQLPADASTDKFYTLRARKIEGQSTPLYYWAEDNLPKLDAPEIYHEVTER